MNTFFNKQVSFTAVNTAFLHAPLRMSDPPCAKPERQAYDP